MQLSDITTYLNVSAQHLADLMGTTRQALNNYTSGRKGKPSKFVAELLAVANLNREEIIFADRFDHPDGENREHPAYWCNIAMEALREAVERGAPQDQVETIYNMIAAVVGPLNIESAEI